MNEVRILRLSKDLETPQIGVMFIDDVPSLVTLELPWKNNQRNVSCIPEGRYTCRRRTSIKTQGRDTFEVDDVPDRAGILFHVGNSTEDTEGCILVGKSFVSAYAIGSSVAGFERFMELLKEVQSFPLIISFVERDYV